MVILRTNTVHESERKHIIILLLQVDTITHLKSQNDLNSMKIFSVRRLELFKDECLLERNTFKAKMYAFVNFTASVRLRTTKLCGKL